RGCTSLSRVSRRKRRVHGRRWSRRRSRSPQRPRGRQQGRAPPRVALRGGGGPSSHPRSCARPPSRRLPPVPRRRVARRCPPPIPHGISRGAFAARAVPPGDVPPQERPDPSKSQVLLQPSRAQWTAAEFPPTPACPPHTPTARR